MLARGTAAPGWWSRLGAPACVRAGALPGTSRLSRYSGRYQFSKHYFPVLADLKDGGQEFQCAKLIDRHPKVRHWVRNLDTAPCGFGLPTSRGRFTPTLWPNWWMAAWRCWSSKARFAERSRMNSKKPGEVRWGAKQRWAAVWLADQAAGWQNPGAATGRGGAGMTQPRSARPSTTAPAPHRHRLGQRVRGGGLRLLYELAAGPWRRICAGRFGAAVLHHHRHLSVCHGRGLVAVAGYFERQLPAHFYA